MAITPKQIIGTAVDLGRGALNLLRRNQTSEPPSTAETSGPPSSVGAPKPGEPRGVKSATAPKRPKAKPAAPRKKAPTSKSGDV